MGLSEDQRAMLRLLAQREQGYDDIAALMGISVGEVRERVKSALDQLEAEGKPVPSEPRAAGPVGEGGPSSSHAAGENPPYPPPAAGASEEGAPSSEEREQGRPAAAQSAERESTPQGSSGRAMRDGRSSSSLPSLSLPESGGARAAIAAGVVALVVLVAVLVVGGGGDEGSDSTTTANSGAAAEGQPTSGNVKELTKAVLEPVGGSGGSGVAVFGRVKNRLALQVEAEGLEPSGDGRSYAIWVAETPQKMLPLASTAVGQDGKIGAQFEAPTEVLGYLANETFDQIVVTEVVDSQLNASLKQATSEGKAPEYTGTEVLSGQITGPIIGAAKKGN